MSIQVIGSANDTDHLLDNTAPTLSVGNILIDNTGLNNHNITLTFNEYLDKTSSETEGNWTVTNYNESVTYNVANAALANNVVTLTLANLNSADVSTYITNADANVNPSLKITPSSSVTDLVGVPYSGGTVSESGAIHELYNLASTLSANNIVIDNTGSSAHNITLTFSEHLNKTLAETENNWVVKNNSNGITYSVANASLTNNIVTLTLSNLDSSNVNTYITNADANAGIRVTPNTAITNLPGIAYSAGTVTELGATHNLDDTAPTALGSSISVNNILNPNTVSVTFSEHISKTVAEQKTNWTLTNNAPSITYSINTSSINNNVATLTLVPTDSANNKTYITNSDISGLKVIPSGNITDLAGNNYSGNMITESSGSHSNDSTGAVLPSDGIVIDNTGSSAHNITLTFNEYLNKTIAETEGNWTLKNHSNAITYSINSSSLTNNIVTLTLSNLDSTDTSTYITNADAAAGIRVTPDAAIKNLPGNTYSGGIVTESGATHNLDSTEPILSTSGIVIDNTGSSAHNITLTFSEHLNKAIADVSSKWAVRNYNDTITYSVASSVSINNVVTLTLSNLDSSDVTTYITNADINQDPGIKIIPNSTITDLAGNTYLGGPVSESEATHNLDSTAPFLSASEIVIDNTSSSHNITLTFNEHLNKTLAETENNWIVTNDNELVTYSISNASLNNNVAILTLTTIDLSDASTYILNADAATGIIVTPNSAITNLAGITYSGGSISESGASHNLAPDVNLTYNMATAKESDDVRITATFTGSATSPKIKHVASGTVEAISYTSMTNQSGNVWYYDYTILTGDGTVSFTIQLGEGTEITPLTGAEFTIDNTRPTGILIFEVNSNSVTHVSNNQSVLITATLNEAIEDIPTLQLSHDNGGGAITAMSPKNMTKFNSTTYTYNYVAPTGDGTATFSFGNDATDLAGNILTVAPSSGSTLIIDNTAPKAEISFKIGGTPVTYVKNGQDVDITANSNQALAVNPVLQIEHNASVGTVDALSATNMTRFNSTTYNYVYNVPTGDGEVEFSFSTGTDLAGNEILSTPNGVLSARKLTIMNTAPVIYSYTADGVFEMDDIYDIDEQADSASTSTLQITLTNNNCDGVANGLHILLGGVGHGSTFSGGVASIVLSYTHLSSLYNNSPSDTFTNYVVNITITDLAGNTTVNTINTISIDRTGEAPPP